MVLQDMRISVCPPVLGRVGTAGAVEPHRYVFQRLVMKKKLFCKDLLTESIFGGQQMGEEATLRHNLFHVYIHNCGKLPYYPNTENKIFAVQLFKIGS